MNVSICYIDKTRQEAKFNFGPDFPADEVDDFIKGFLSNMECKWKLLV